MTYNHTDPLPSGWTWTTIDSVTQEINKVNPASEPTKSFIYLDISSIDNSKNIISNPQTYEGVDAPSRARQLVKANDTLFSTVRTYLRNIAYVPEIYDSQIASTGFSVLRAEMGVAPKYIFYLCLESDFLTQLGKLQRGSSYPAIRDSDLREQLIPLPPSNEQQHIVEEIEAQFTRLDAGIEVLKRLRKNLKRYKSAVLKAACEGTLVESGSNYESASELLEQILQERRQKWETDLRAKGRDPRKFTYEEPNAPDTSNLPQLPEGWVWASLDALSWDYAYGTSEKCDKEFKGPPVLRIPNISQGKLSLEDIKYAFLEEGWNEREAVMPGDLLVIRTNGSKSLIGRGALIRDTFKKPHYYASYLIRFRLLDIDTIKNWTAVVWDADIIRKQLNQIASTSAGQYNVNSTNLRKIAIPIPPKKIIEDALSELDEIKALVEKIEVAINASIHRAERLRQSILREAFAGRLVPQDPNDEPAFELLERIQQARAQRKSSTRKKKSS